MRFAPYTSKYHHAGMKIYHASVSVGNMGIAYRTSNHATQLEQIHVPINDKEWVELHNLILDADDGFQHERKRKFILQDFATIIQRITNNFTASIWKTIKACPLLTIHEVLWLKVDDVDGHMDHLEKMLIQVIEENKLLQRRLDLLEKLRGKDYIENMIVIEENKLLQHKMEQSLKDADRILIPVIDENKLLQRRLNALEQKGILYELD